MNNPYIKDVSNLDKIDIYRILNIYEVSDHALGHAIKKLLCAGNRGHKDKYQDVVEACKSLDRWLEMYMEDKKTKEDNKSITIAENAKSIDDVYKDFKSVIETLNKFASDINNKKATK